MNQAGKARESSGVNRSCMGMALRLLFMGATAIIVSSASAMAGDFAPCGKYNGQAPNLDQKGSSLQWENALNLRYDISNSSSRGVVCLGHAEGATLEYDRFVYRDDVEMVYLSFGRRELAGNPVILKSSDFPWYVRLFLKNDVAITRVLDAGRDSLSDDLKFRLTFLRNLSGSQENDYRYIDLRYKKTSEGKHAVVLGNSGKYFDLMVFDISLIRPTIMGISFYSGDKIVGRITAEDCPRAS